MNIWLMRHTVAGSPPGGLYGNEHRVVCSGCAGRPRPGGDEVSNRVERFYNAPMAVGDDFRDYVLEQLATGGRVTSKRMFGGVGLYLDGLFIALIDDDTLYFKTDDSNRARYQRAGSQPFCPYPDRPEQQMGYWQVPAEVLEDADELKIWAREALAVALRSKSSRRTARTRARPTRTRRPT